MKSFVVIGLGRFGSEAAIRLSEQGCEVLRRQKERWRELWAVPQSRFVVRCVFRRPCLPRGL